MNGNNADGNEVDGVGVGSEGGLDVNGYGEDDDGESLNDNDARHAMVTICDNAQSYRISTDSYALSRKDPLLFLPR